MKFDFYNRSGEVKMIEIKEDYEKVKIYLESKRIEDPFDTFLPKEYVYSIFPYKYIDYCIKINSAFSLYISVSVEEENGKYLIHHNSNLGLSKNHPVMKRFIKYLEENHIRNVVDLRI